MFPTTLTPILRRLTFMIAIAGVALFMLIVTPATASAAPTVYEFETSLGRTCRAEVNVEQRGGFLILRELRFDSTVTCDDLAGQAAPILGGGDLMLYNEQLEPLNVVLAAGERSTGFGYFCEDATDPCRDQGRFPLSVVGDYYAQSNFALSLDFESGETWSQFPDDCTLIDPDFEVSAVSCGLRSETLNIGVLR